MDILGQSSLIVGVMSFALGFSVLSRNVRNKLYLAFSVLTLLISLWALALPLDRLMEDRGGTYYRWHLFFNIWLAPASLAFIHVMVRIHDQISRRLLDISIAAALSLSIALVFGFDSIPWVKQLVLFIPGVTLLQILRLMWIDKKLKRGLKKHPKLPTVGLGRRNLIYLGGIAVLMTSVMDHVPFMGNIIPSFGNLGLVAYLFFISQAISQQRLLNFGALLSRFFVLIAVALILTGVYSILVGWIENSPGLFFLNSFIASFLILMLLEPIRAVVGYFTQRLLTQKHLRLEQILRESQRKLAGIVDLGGLFQTILTTTEQTLYPEWVAIFMLRGDGTKYRRVRVSSEDQSYLREILANNPLLEYCERMNRRGQLPILLDLVIENEIDRSASRAQRTYYAGLVQGLRALGANLLIPLIADGRVPGFVAVRVVAPPEPWGNNWGLLPILYPYYTQAAQSLQNMEVFVKQREKERLAALGEMAAGLAHEIRNPLGAIKGAAQFLDPSVEKPESRFLNIIIEEVDRLNHVVTQFLDYSKPPSTNLQKVDLAPLLQKTVESFLPSVKSGIQVQFRQSRSSAFVQAAPEQIQQVVLNLIQNSVKALEGKPGGEGRVDVSVDVEGQGKSREVIATVEDNGKGIKREHLDKLFIPFFTTSPSGTGLGLSISQKIIEAHHGRIEVATEEGRFTRFSVILPYEE